MGRVVRLGSGGLVFTLDNVRGSPGFPVFFVERCVDAEDADEAVLAGGGDGVVAADVSGGPGDVAD